MRYAQPGDHLRVRRDGAYWHHGIYEGPWVINYTGEPKAAIGASIERVSFDAFAAGGVVELVEYGQADHPDQVLARARSRLHEQAFHLLSNNCEHFARWCKTGVPNSEQVRRTATAGTGALLGRGAVGAGVAAVASGGAVAGLSGAGMMSGLAALGGTAVGGMVVGSVAPSAVAVHTIDRLLADDPSLALDERAARRSGRVAGKVGAGVGTVGAVALVAAAGVPGLSAVGISTGLATVGAVVGGGMLAGVVTVFALPAAVAGVFAWLGSRPRK